MVVAVETSPLTVLLDRSKPQAVVAVRGTADRSNIFQLTKVLERLVEEERRCVCLDTAELVGIDAEAFEAIVRCAGGYRDRACRLRLVRSSKWFSDYLRETLMSELFCPESECRWCSSSTTCESASQQWTADVFTLPSTMANCREARVRVARAAESQGFSELGAQDIAMAVGEAVSNAVQHGRVEGGENSFTVMYIATPDKLCVTVTDSGPGFDPESLPGLEHFNLEERGRGILCMRALMDEVTFQFSRGTTVRMVKFRR